MNGRQRAALALICCAVLVVGFALGFLLGTGQPKCAPWPTAERLCIETNPMGDNEPIAYP